nr:hypothetical protein [Tanacetum cinerariifolium]
VHQFFTKLTSVVNVICASSKRHDKLQKAKSIEIQHLLELGKIKTGKGANQIGTLRRAGDTRWGSHFDSVCSMFRMFNPTRSALEIIIEDGSCASQRGEADAAYIYLKSFEFIFILHLMKEVMGRNDILNQALQKKKQDIGNAVELVSATKKSLNEFRNNGWDIFLQHVILFCEKYQIEVPDMEAPYKSTRYRPRRQDNHGFSMAGSSSKLGSLSEVDIKGTGDNVPPSAVHTVLSNDDLFIEILLRLPVISLQLFKSVSKHWLSIITSPNFTRSRQIFKLDPPCGLLILRANTEKQ